MSFTSELAGSPFKNQKIPNLKEILKCGPEYSHDAMQYRSAECGIYVGNLLVDRLSKDDIFHIFEKYGEIEAIR